MLDPQARALLDLMAEKGVPPTHTLTPEEARRLYRERRFYTQPDPLPVESVRTLEAATPAGPVPLRLYRPAGLATPAPVLVYFHGGGWTIGDLDTHDVLCRALAAVPAARWRRSTTGSGPSTVSPPRSTMR
jgi:acetyl esterase